MRFFARSVELFLEFLFPKDEIIEEIENMSPIEFLEKSSRLRPDRALPGSIILFEYQNDLVRRALHEVKFRGNRKISRLIGEIIDDVLVGEMPDLAIFRGVKNPILVPIPMTLRSLRKRGWNQCEYLLSTVIERCVDHHIEYAPKALVKIRETADQVGQTRAKRLANLEGCFRADENIVSGRSVIVFDDIVTTGATMKEARRALRSAGARRIIFLAVAH